MKTLKAFLRGFWRGLRAGYFPVTSMRTFLHTPKEDNR